MISSDCWQAQKKLTAALTRTQTSGNPRDWIVGGRSLAEQGKSSFFFDIKIVDETNTKAQKAEYVRETFDAFERLLPNLHEESYLHIDDVRPTTYGYGGRTQEFRYHHGV